MTAIYKQSGAIATVPAPGGGVTIKDGVLITKLLGVALDTKAAGKDADLQRVGQVEVKKVSAQAWVIGDRIYWDDAAKLFTIVWTPIIAGTAAKVAANPSSTGEIHLTPGLEDRTHAVSIAIPTKGGLADGAIFIANRPYRVLSVSEDHAVAGSDGGAVTLDVKKQTGTQTPAQGVSTLAATFDLKGTANTTVTKTGAGLTAVAADLVLAAGNRLSFDFTGTLTAVAGLVVTIELEIL